MLKLFFSVVILEVVLAIDWVVTIIFDIILLIWLNIGYIILIPFPTSSSQYLENCEKSWEHNTTYYLDV